MFITESGLFGFILVLYGCPMLDVGILELITSGPDSFDENVFIAELVWLLGIIVDEFGI